MTTQARAVLRIFLAGTLLTLSLSSTTGVAAQTTGVDLTGQWNWTNVSVQTGSFYGIATIQHDVAAGTLTWTWTGNTTSSIWEGTGTVSGSSFTMSGHEGDTYTAEQQGTIIDENHLEGTWTQSDGQYGTSSAVRIGSSETEECTSQLTSGYFEPTQGVWQDDAILPGTEEPGVVANFPDLSGKQLVSVAPLADELRYEAQLHMVKNRPTLLFGIDHAVGGPAPADRYNIVLEGTTNCTEKKSTRLRFTLVQGGSVKTLATSPVLPLKAKLGGSPGVTSTFKVKLPTSQGFPRNAFTIPSEGDYLIRAEVILDGDGPTDLKVDVVGEVVSTEASKVAFVPIAINDRSSAAKTALRRSTVHMALESYRHVPDLFPLPPRKFPVTAWPVEDISTYAASAQQEWVDWLRQLSDFTTSEKLFSQVRLAAVDRRFAGIAQLSTGAGRAVAVFSDQDFNLLLPQSLRNRVGGFTSSSKFIAVPSDATWETVAHEYAHSVPEFLWSKNEMLAECGIDYHNAVVTAGGQKKKVKIAHGFQITDGPENEVDLVQDPKVSIMGPVSSDPWIDQCTYWHLLKVLQEPIDPPTILVQGRLAQTDIEQIGELFPLYQLDGVVDLASGSEGEWAFVMRDAEGLELGRYPFEPRFTLDDGTDRDVIAFTYRLPDLERIAAIDLVGPEGVLDTRAYSATAPSVSVITPKEDGKVTPTRGKVKITWSGEDPDGDELLYTVAYSSNGGSTWTVQAFERTANAFKVRVAPNKTSHLVRVTVTDGERSSEAEVSFTTP